MLAKILILFTLISASYANDFLHFFNNTQSFSADFIQEVNTTQTRGKLFFAKPKSLKWHTTSPEESIVMLHNDVVTKYDVWIQSANIIPYTHNELIEYLTTPPEKLIQLPRFIGSKDDVRYYELGTIYFGFTNRVLSEIIITNELEQHIYVSLQNVVRNTNITKEFVIEFAKDVDILDETR